MNTNRFFILLFNLLMILSALPAFAEVVATVDRASIVADETLTLTITRDGSSFFTDPDLDPLEKDFKVLGQSQQSSTQIINGSASSSVSWKITLAPRRAGKLEIPQLSVGKEKTASLTVQVSAEAQAKTSADGVPIFIETDVDEQSVFVQSQVLYTLRIYWATDVQIMDPGQPDLADALIEKLDDATYEKTINGNHYRVFERKYSIFPQKSGVLKIPQMVLQVNVPSRQNRLNRFDPFGNQGEMLKLRSESEEVTVKEKPQEYPASAVWLPSAGLVIKDDWSLRPQDLKVGESATLSLSVTADGLMAEQLPPIEPAEPEGLKLYQGKAEIENLKTSTGIIGTRKESIALIPTRSGEIELPEIRIPWWDKKNQKIEYAIIPAQKLVVHGTVKQPETQSPDVDQNTIAPAAPTVPAVQKPVPQSASTAVVILCAVFAAAWLITLILLFSTRRKMNELVHGQAGKAELESAVKEREAFHSLAAACRANDPVMARESVVAWARTFWSNEKILTFTDIARTVPEPEFLPLLGEIDRALYGQGKSPGQWQGGRLLEQVKKIRKGREKKKSSNGGLQKLYK